tara:strand:- start:800 stop:1408 length:609 start_codon:yes stop_codon:yes gene_type:complete
MKLISPSSIKYIAGLSLDSVYEVEFNSNIIGRLPEPLFAGNVQHDTVDYIYNQDASYEQALVSALFKNKQDRTTDLTKNELNKIEHNIKFGLDYLRNKVVEIEMKVFQKYDRTYYQQAIGGTADIVIMNDDDTITIADFKNYNNPSTSDLAKAYYQTLVYATLVRDTHNVKIKEIQIVYPSQEQIITLPYQEVDTSTIKSRW